MSVKPLVCVALLAAGCSTAAPAPSFTASLTSPTDVVLRWPDDDDGHRVDYANDPAGPWTTLRFLPPHMTSYHHPDLLPETPFYYREQPFTGPVSAGAARGGLRRHGDVHLGRPLERRGRLPAGDPPPRRAGLRPGRGDRPGHDDVRAVPAARRTGLGLPPPGSALRPALARWSTRPPARSGEALTRPRARAAGTRPCSSPRPSAMCSGVPSATPCRRRCRPPGPCR